jgi:hypothetical protein
MSYKVNTSTVVTCRMPKRLEEHAVQLGSRRAANPNVAPASWLKSEVFRVEPDDDAIPITTLPPTTIASAPKLLTYPVGSSQRGVCAVDP